MNPVTKAFWLGVVLGIWVGGIYAASVFLYFLKRRTKQLQERNRRLTFWLMEMTRHQRAAIEAAGRMDCEATAEHNKAFMEASRRFDFEYKRKGKL